MNYHYVSNYLNSSYGKKATKEEIKKILRLESETNDVDEYVLNNIDFIGKDMECNVIGIKNLIEKYYSVDSEKMDLLIPLSEIGYIGFYHNEEIILSFENNTWNAKGTYNFTSDFLDSLFSMNKYARFCLNAELKELIAYNLENQLIARKDEIRQYRFLMKNDEMLLRGITSKNYRNYDNHIAIYLISHALHKYSKLTKKQVFLQNATVTDSDLTATFIVNENIKISNNLYLSTGIILKNNELGKGSFRIEYTYRLSNSDYNFSAIGQKVMGLNHNASTKRVEDEIGKLSILGQLEKETINYIRQIKNIDKLDREQLSLIFLKLSRVRELTEGTKNKIEEVRQELVDNTYSLLEVFGKLDKIQTKIDEKEFIQITFNELIYTGLKK